MKRIIALGLIFLMIMVSCLGCKKSKPVSDTPQTDSQSQSSVETNAQSDVQSDVQSNVQSNTQSTVSKNETSSAGKTEQSNDKVVNIEAYQKLVCRTVSSNQMTSARIKDTKTGLVMQIDIPSDWVLSKVNTQTFNISRNGKKIGILTTAALPGEDKKFESRYSYDDTMGADVDWYIAMKKENGQEKFYRAFKVKGYYYEEKYSINISIEYTELDKKTADNMASNIKTVVPERKLTPLSQTNGSKKILILGNSFIGSSQIGQFLNDMLRTANKGYTVNAVSWGGAEIDTYLADSNTCNAIRNGEYCYVFQCGFYSASSVDDFGEMKSICDTSDTPIVIFPAHNESEFLANNTFDKYRNVPLLNWKGKVQSLIDDGVAYFDMCENDGSRHSKPLAGYVGACMIYKMVFGENPPTITSQAPLSPQYVNSKLGAYKDTICLMDNFSGKLYEIN